jgi:hypothetical protein
MSDKLKKNAKNMREVVIKKKEKAEKKNENRKMY